MQIPFCLNILFPKGGRMCSVGFSPKGKTALVYRGIFLIFVLSSFGQNASAQLQIVDKTYDFGMLLRADDNWTDFEIRNAGTKDAVIFRVEGPKNIDVKLSAKTVKPGTSEFIRVAVSPKEAGKFKIDLKVFASAWQKPETIEILGESSFVASSMIPCPDFSGNRSTADNEFHISVRDRAQNIPLQDANIDVYKDGRKVVTIQSNEYGEVSARLPYGRYFFSIQSDGGQIDTALYINAVSNHLVAMLDAKRVSRGEPVVIDEIASRNTRELPERVSENEVTLKPRVIETASLPQNREPELIEPENAVMPLTDFKQNNLVFLVDVSASMNRFGKLDLLKIAMVQLLDVLRSVDRFSLISYSSETNVIIETETRLDREACIKAILALEARGSTAGAKAIDRAGEVALLHFVETGNNQIILATDGAFDEGVDKALRLAAKYAGKDVRLSILGIKCGPATTKQMQELTDAGAGRFVPINLASDAGGQLIDEIKKSSVR